MGLEHLYGRIVAVALGALLGVCALLATAKFVRRRARLLSPLVRAHGALFAVMMGLMAMAGMFRSFGKLPQNYGIMELWNYGNEALGIAGETQFHNATLTHLHNSTISESDVSNGWRVVYTTDGAALTPPFEGVATNGDWRLCGAQVPFSLSDGELGAVTVSCAQPDFQTFTLSNLQTFKPFPSPTSA